MDEKATGDKKTEIRHITKNDLKNIPGEGLVLQRCGGYPQEWIDSISKELADENILLDGDHFKTVSIFENRGGPNMLFHMDDVKLDVGRLAMWRLRSHEALGGTWLSDYLSIYLGVRTDEGEMGLQKPDCPLIGADGNIYNLIAVAKRTLKENDMREAAEKMQSRVFESGSYEQALGIILEYVNPVDATGQEGGFVQSMM